MHCFDSDAAIERIGRCLLDHETITVASLLAARAWLAITPSAPLHRALSELLVSKCGRSDWPLAYWSKPVLFSVTARRSWVEPDLRPLPF
jgi:hypothetical protein